MTLPSSFASSKTTGRLIEKSNHRGLFAIDDIDAGEVVVVFGGRVISSSHLEELARAGSHQILQIDDEHFLFSDQDGAGDWVNHSCEPNLGFRGQIVLVAMRDIQVGEEICFDYAMSDGSAYDEFDCHCGSSRCRGRITGEDWRNPTLWKRYEGYFSPYLTRRIARQRWHDLALDDTSNASPHL